MGCICGFLLAKYLGSGSWIRGLRMRIPPGEIFRIRILDRILSCENFFLHSNPYICGTFKSKLWAYNTGKKFGFFINIFGSFKWRIPYQEWKHILNCWFSFKEKNPSGFEDLIQNVNPDPGNANSDRDPPVHLKTLNLKKKISTNIKNWTFAY